MGSRCAGALSWKWPGQLDGQLSEEGSPPPLPTCREMFWKGSEEAGQRVVWFDGLSEEHVIMENSLWKL